MLARNDLNTLEQRINACEQTAVSYSLRNMISYPWIRERVEAGSLELVACYYDLRSGELAVLDEINVA